MKVFDKNEELLACPVQSGVRASSIESKLSPSLIKRSKLSHCKASYSSQSMKDTECIGTQKGTKVKDEPACHVMKNTVSVENKNAVRRDTPRSRVCSYCGAGFYTGRALSRHTKEIHHKHKYNHRRAMTVCIHCNKSVQRASLKRHVLHVHKIVTESTAENEQSQQQGVQSFKFMATAQQCDNDQSMIQQDFTGEPSTDQTIPAHLLKILPASDYQYSIISYHDTLLSSNSFTSSFIINIDSHEQFDGWKNRFQTITCTQYTIMNTPKIKEGSSIRFKQYLKCLHCKQRGKIGTGRNTRCPARLTVTIAQCSAKKKITSTFSCQIDLSWCHNHPIKAGDVVRHHMVTPATDAKIIKLLSEGHSVNAARDLIRADIDDAIEAQEESSYIPSEDRSICPDYHHCHYMFQKIFKNKYGRTKDNKQLLQFITEYNSEHGDNTIMHEEYNGKSLIAICTPLMKRVHQKIREAGELMFVDSSGGFDRNGNRIFLFVTHSKAGGIPLAVGITPSESLDALTRLFSLIKQVLPEYAFYHRGRDPGPQLVMTNDHPFELEALQNVWPQ